jgi:hypothetical protein
MSTNEPKLITNTMRRSRIDTEKKLQAEIGSTERKNRQLLSLGRKESQYLRLRRTRLGLEDFVTVKVIGKGAFGEVRTHFEPVYFNPNTILKLVFVRFD